MSRLKIGALARQAGVTVKTIRFYDQIGLLPPAERTSSGYRLYSEREVARLLFIRKAVLVGLSLDEVREILRLYDQGQPCCPHARAIIQVKIEDLSQRIAKLNAFRDDLVHLLGTPVPLSDSSKICPIIEHGSEDVQAPERKNGIISPHSEDESPRFWSKYQHRKAGH